MAHTVLQDNYFMTQTHTQQCFSTQHLLWKTLTQEDAKGYWAKHEGLTVNAVLKIITMCEFIFLK